MARLMIEEDVPVYIEETSFADPKIYYLYFHRKGGMMVSIGFHKIRRDNNIKKWVVERDGVRIAALSEFIGAAVERYIKEGTFWNGHKYTKK